jgi:hypothetical protein
VRTNTRVFPVVFASLQPPTTFLEPFGLSALPTAFLNAPGAANLLFLSLSIEGADIVPVIFPDRFFQCSFILQKQILVGS